jgi:hypothetical protein
MMGKNIIEIYEQSTHRNRPGATAPGEFSGGNELPDPQGGIVERSEE